VRRKSLKVRFDTKVEQGGLNGCWKWTGAKTQAGYGRISVEGKPKTATRVSYETYREPIPKGLVLDHFLFPDKCIGPSCCNPQHLMPTTRSENAARNSWARKEHCPSGHEYSQENTALETNRCGRKSRRCKKCRIKNVRRWQAKNPGKCKRYQRNARLRAKAGKQVGSVKASDSVAA
jgi:hypothetical protein